MEEILCLILQFIQSALGLEGWCAGDGSLLGANVVCKGRGKDMYRRPQASLRDHRGVRGGFTRGHIWDASWRRSGSLPGVMEGVGWLFPSKKFSRGKACPGERHQTIVHRWTHCPVEHTGPEIFAGLMEFFFHLWHLPGSQCFIYALEIPDHCIYLTCGDTKHIFIVSFDWSVFFTTPSIERSDKNCAQVNDYSKLQPVSFYVKKSKMIITGNYYSVKPQSVHPLTYSKFIWCLVFKQTGALLTFFFLSLHL